MLSGVVCPREAKSLPICEPVSYEQMGESVIIIIFCFFKGEIEERCALRYMCARWYSDFFPFPVPFISKLHLEFVDYICLICHSASTTDNAERARVPLLQFYFPFIFLSLRSEQFL